MSKVAIVSEMYFFHFLQMHRVRASTILSNISIFSLFRQVRDKNMTCTTLPTLIANAKFIHRSSYKIFHAGCSPQLVREMLAMLQLVDILWVKLNFTQNRVFAFLRRKQYVHMEIEWTLALANLILHANDLKMVGRLDALIGAHKSSAVSQMNDARITSVTNCAYGHWFFSLRYSAIFTATRLENV